MSSMTWFGIGERGPVSRFPDGTQWHPPSMSCADHDRALLFEMRTGDPGLFLTVAPPRIYVPEVFVQALLASVACGGPSPFRFLRHTGAPPLYYLSLDGEVLTAQGTNRRVVYRMLHRSADGMWCAEWPD